MSRTYQLSPLGELAPYAWLTKADTKFNTNGVFHGELILEGEDASAFKKIIDDAAREAFDAEIATAEKDPKKHKTWELQVPYEEDGDKLGVTFKQNATITPKDPKEEPISVKIRIEDSQGNEVTGPIAIHGGSTVRFYYATRPVVLRAAKRIGVRLDFMAVQIIDLKGSEGGSSGGSRFGKVEGGFVASSKPKTDADVAAAAEEAAGADEGDY